MLPFDRHIPPGAADGAPLIVLLHSRGSHPGDLMGLQPHLPPAAIVAAPQAPFPGAPWGYGPGWAWYRFLDGRRPEPECFAATLGHLDDFLEALPALLPVRPGPLVLGGFSQGGTVSLAYATSHPGRVVACLNFSGFLADHPAVQLTPAAVANTRFFWGHGQQDPNIPYAMALEGRARLRAAGAQLTEFDFPGGHWIDPAELAAAVDVVRRSLSGK